MAHKRPLIALDISRHDHLHLGHGLYRYGVDLVNGLARVRPNVDFLLIGSNPEPVPEVRGVLTEPGSRWSYFSIRRRERGRSAYFLDQWSFVRQVSRLPIRLYHSTDLFVPFLLPAPLVMTIYDLMFELFPWSKPYRESWYITCLKRAIRHRLSRVIAISRTTADDLHSRWRVPSKKLVVTPLGTRMLGRDREVSQMVHKNEKGPVLLSRYALSPWKNLPSLAAALALLRNEFPDVRLRLFGKADVRGEGEAEFDRVLERLGVGDLIERTGVLTEDELLSSYANATVFVLPSLYEGFGLPLIEAMACGVCVVAHDASAMAEVVGSAGCLTDARRPEALAGAIAPLLRDVSRRAQLVELGRERAAQFTVEAMAEATYSVYRACLNC